MSTDVTILNTGKISFSNLFTNPSFETAFGSTTVRTNLAVNPNTLNPTSIPVGGLGWAARWYGSGGAGTTTKVTGASDGPLPALTAYLRKTWTTGAGPGDTGFQNAQGDSNSGTSTNGFPVTAGWVYTVSGYLRATSSAVGARTANVTFYWRDSSGNYVGGVAGPQIALTNGQWGLVSFTATAPANAATMGVNIDPDIGPNWVAADTLDGTGLLVEASPVLGTYFDGNTAAAGDFSYAWTGTANASTSVMTGVGVAALGSGTPNHGVSVQSSDWAVTPGGKSLRIVPTNNNTTAGTNDTFQSLSTSGFPSASSVAGQTLTLSGTVRLPAALTGSLAGTALGFRAQVSVSGVFTDIALTYSARATNAPGVYEVTASGPIPAGTTAWTFMRLYNGAFGGNGDVWWDNIVATIGPGAYTGGYFDGSHASDSGWTATWTGAANASTSTQTATTSTGLGNASSYSVVEDATPLDPSSSAGGYGQVTVTVPEFPNSRSVMSRTIALSDGAHGITQGVIASLTSDEFTVTLTANSQLSALNTVVNAAPYSGTLGGYFTYLLSLVGITSGFQVDATITGNAVAFPGWQGNLWDYAKMLCAGQQVEITLVSDLIVMRPLRVNIAQTYRDQQHTATLDNSSIAQQVACFYYQPVQRAAGLAFPLAGIKSNTNIESIDANQSLVVTLPLTPTGANGTGLGASLQSIQQPVCVDNMTLGYTGSSAYTIIGNDGKPYPAAKWVANGGSVTAAVGADSASIVVTLNGCSDASLAPYRLAIPDPAIPNVFYSSLYLVGAGIFYNKQLTTVQTGNGPAQTTTVAPPTIDNFAIATASDARSAALWAANTAQGPALTLAVTTNGINAAGDSNTYTQMTMGQFDALFAAGTFGAFDAQFPGETFGQFDAWSMAQVAGQFTNQAFGNLAGARVLYQNAWYRISTATITPFGVSYTAVADTTFGDFDGVWSGQTFGAFDAVWSTRTFGQFAPGPLAVS